MFSRDLIAFALATAFIAPAIISPAFAGDETPKADAREAKQQQRIDQGVQSGALTSTETAKLDARSDRIDAREAKMKADGKMTRHERARLEHSLNKESRAIKRQKHDKEHS